MLGVDMTKQRPRVSLFLRKPRAGRNFSVERLFDAVGAAFPAERYEVRRLVCPFESKGVIRRLLLVIWAACNQGDINHITGDVNFIGLLMRRSKTVLTILDSGSMQRLSGLRRKIYEWIWLRLPIARAGYVTVISEETLRETFSYISADSNKFRVIPCCLTGELRLHPKEFKAVSPRILHIGTNPNKNLPRVIEAVAGITCVLVIVGTLSVEQTQLLKSRDIVYENYVGLDDTAMSQQYQLADVVVFVSTYEGFGLPILEAQAVGRAVVTSARAPMDDVAGSGAVLVDPDSVDAIRAAIKKVIEDTEYRNSLILAGIDNVKRFSPENVAAQYAAVYEMLFKQSQHS